MGFRQRTLEDLGMNPAFWHGRRVLITGHTGFKGSWLSLWLQSLGAEVSGYALEPPTEPSLFETARVAQGMTSIIGDIRDRARLGEYIDRLQPEIIVHMAAQPLVRESYRDPVTTYETNIMGTVNLLEAVRASASARVVINVTSDKCYENREWAWGYREHDPMGGHDPYSSSKGCAELVTQAYRRSFFDHGGSGTALASARAGNVIGGGDWAQDRLIPDMIRALQQGETIRIRNPAAIRPWQHVLEPLSGYLNLAERLWAEPGQYADGWNFGPHEHDARPVGWIADRFVEAWGGNARWTHDGGEHPHEAHYLKLDCTKAREALGWLPILPLDETIAGIVDWHKACQQGADMRAYTEDCIRAYQARRTTGETSDGSESAGV